MVVHNVTTDSQSDSSRLSSDAIAEARAIVLQHFNVGQRQPHNHHHHHHNTRGNSGNSIGNGGAQWGVAFTSNASAALKVVAELFPFQRGSALHYTQSNHTSVLGMRQYVARSCCVSLDVPTCSLLIRLPVDTPSIVVHVYRLLPMMANRFYHASMPTAYAPLSNTPPSTARQISTTIELSTKPMAL
jgi:hypothetical protein